MKIKILRNLGAGWPALAEGQICEVGKDIAGDVAHRLVKSGWLAEEVRENKSEPVPAPEVKAVEPVQAKGKTASVGSASK